jgi:hypothetical protein
MKSVCIITCNSTNLGLLPARGPTYRIHKDPAAAAAALQLAGHPLGVSGFDNHPHGRVRGVCKFSL